VPQPAPPQFKLLRDITGQQFAEAIDEALAPRAKITGGRSFQVAARGRGRWGLRSVRYGREGATC
jgi:hypothetical protein